MRCRALREKRIDRALLGAASNVVYNANVRARADSNSHMRQPRVQQPG